MTPPTTAGNSTAGNSTAGNLLTQPAVQPALLGLQPAAAPQTRADHQKSLDAALKSVGIAQGISGPVSGLANGPVSRDDSSRIIFTTNGSGEKLKIRY